MRLDERNILKPTPCRHMPFPKTGSKIHRIRRQNGFTGKHFSSSWLVTKFAWSEVNYMKIRDVWFVESYACFFLHCKFEKCLDESCALDAMSNFDLTLPREQGHISLCKVHRGLELFRHSGEEKNRSAAMQKVSSLSQTALGAAKKTTWGGNPPPLTQVRARVKFHYVSSGQKLNDSCICYSCSGQRQKHSPDPLTYYRKVWI